MRDADVPSSAHPSLAGLWFVRREAFRRDEVLFEQGEPAFGLYLLCAGRIKLWRRTREGQRQLLAILEGEDPPPLLGLEALIAPAYETTASALRSGQALFLAREEFPRLPGRDLLAGAAQAYVALLRGLAQTLGLPAEARLARFLLRNDGPELLNVLRREELAEHLGLSLEHTCRLLRRWEERGWLRREGQHHVTVTEAGRRQMKALLNGDLS